MAQLGVDAVMVLIGHTFDILPEQFKHVTENSLAGSRQQRGQRSDDRGPGGTPVKYQSNFTGQVGTATYAGRNSEWGIP